MPPHTYLVWQAHEEDAGHQRALLGLEHLQPQLWRGQSLCLAAGMAAVVCYIRCASLQNCLAELSMSAQLLSRRGVESCHGASKELQGGGSAPSAKAVKLTDCIGSQSALLDSHELRHAVHPTLQTQQHSSTAAQQHSSTAAQRHSSTALPSMPPTASGKTLRPPAASQHLPAGLA